jgi:hypothetical protein
MTWACFFCQIARSILAATPQISFVRSRTEDKPASAYKNSSNDDAAGSKRQRKPIIMMMSAPED